MIRVNNLHSKSIVHSDNGGTTNIVNKGCILHTGILNDEPVVPIRIVLEQQIINNISLSVDRTISGDSGIPDFIEFLIYFYELFNPSFLGLGGNSHSPNFSSAFYVFLRLATMSAS